MACGKNCGDNCGCCFEDGVATTTHQAGGCTVFDVVISSDACNTVSLGSDGGLLVKECVEVFEDSLCDDATDPATPFERTTVIACDGTRTVTDTTPDGDPYTVVGNVVCCGGGGSSETVTTLTNTVLGHLIGTYTNELGVPVDINETITALGYNPATNILTYTDETGAPTNVDLTALAIDINVGSLAYNPLTGVITLTETDGSVHTIDIGPPVETVTTLVETPANKTATYTNELGATTVLSETDFTANSQIIPGTCEGVLDDADVKRELPVRWDTVSNTYKAYDDGKNTALTFQSPWNGTDKPSGGVNTPTGYTWTTPISSIVINNPSACRPMVLYNNLLKAMSVNSNDSAGLPRVTFTGFQDNGSGTFAVASVNVLSSQVNAVGQIDDTVLSFLYPMALNTIPAGASITLRSYQDAVYTQGNSAGGASNASSGFGQIQGIGVVQ